MPCGRASASCAASAGLSPGRARRGPWAPTRQTITSIEVEKYTASLPLAHKIARYFGLTIEDVFDFSEIDEEL